MREETGFPGMFPVVVRAVVWLILFAALYLLRSFFLLIFLTFLFAYIQAQAVERLHRFIPRRVPRVIIVGLVLLTLVISVTSFLLPSVVEQAKLFGLNFTSYIKSVDVEVAKLTVRYPNLKASFPQLAPLDSFIQGGWQNWRYEESPSGEVFRQIAGIGDEGDGDGLRHAIGTLRNIGAYLASIISAFLLSLIFSFLIVLDLPHLMKGARDLKFTKAGFVYDTVAPSILRFGKVLGRAMEAQFLIAMVNTILTVIGVWVIGIKSKLAFISMIVFFCSFIPVAGVFLSSIPICLLALQASGIGLMLLSIVVIIAVHQVEAYILNPRIYGQQLHINPVIVLIVLTISGKLFGIWGLILGLPIVTYVFRYAIREHEAVKPG